MIFVVYFSRPGLKEKEKHINYNNSQSPNKQTNMSGVTFYSMCGKKLVVEFNPNNAVFLTNIAKALVETFIPKRDYGIYLFREEDQISQCLFDHIMVGLNKSKTPTTYFVLIGDRQGNRIENCSPTLTGYFADFLIENIKVMGNRIAWMGD